MEDYRLHENIALCVKSFIRDGKSAPLIASLGRFKNKKVELNKVLQESIESVERNIQSIKNQIDSFKYYIKYSIKYSASSNLKNLFAENCL